MGPPKRLLPRGEAPVPLVFHRGARAPYATRWFGVTSLAGHARNYIASAIAAESIDSRDWMEASTAEMLLGRVVRVLGGDPSRPTLTAALGRAVWVDFVADTGDDRDVSHAVGKMLFATYELEEGGGDRLLPRGDILLFGGDTAYPVATGEEIARRVVAPFNESLGGSSAERRVLLGIPGNHDWYDGLDGFARLFRRRAHAPAPTPPEPGGGAGTEDGGTSARRRRRRARAGAVARQLHLDELGGVMRLIAGAWAATRAFWSGTKIARPRRLSLIGYESVQDASYWALPLAPGLDAWGVDRQLGRLDYRQRLFFGERRRQAAEARVLFVAPEPAFAYGERHEPGARMLSACRLSLERDAVFYLTGDVHHYERLRPGRRSLHVIAGGGGAFLHGTRVAPSSSAVVGPPARAWPSAATSRRLVGQVPFKLMAGSAGFLLHVLFAFIAGFELALEERGPLARLAVVLLVAAGLSFALYAAIGRERARPWQAVAVAVPFGLGVAVVPPAVLALCARLVPAMAGDPAPYDVLAVLLSAFAGPLAIGLFLAAIALLGLEHQQAYSVLSHPGFKHFVRICVHPDGRVEGWVIGADDPVGGGAPTLVDRFDWSP